MDENPYMFVANRSLDTLIGIVLGLVLNYRYMKKMEESENKEEGEGTAYEQCEPAKTYR
jgi:hypothetical protein